MNSRLLDLGADAVRSRIVRTMVARQTVRTLAADASVRDAALAMATYRIGAILVTEASGTLIGIFTERDVVNRVLAKDLSAKATRLSTVMTPSPETIEADEDAMEALRRMHEGGFRHLPVMDRGRVIGVVSLRDFLGAELQSLEDELDRRRRILEG